MLYTDTTATSNNDKTCKHSVVLFELGDFGHKIFLSLAGIQFIFETIRWIWRFILKDKNNGHIHNADVAASTLFNSTCMLCLQT